ncbi:MAG: polysaccharide pyruvyl transferase family protein [Salinivirgaceae bacterium]|nr:polysaccharide pyruvyl transferase family protein [Salinivirgaceae bacterium]
MKVCIVTAYNNLNSGSYWQAFALGYILKNAGCEVYYYKCPSKGAKSSIRETIKNIWKKLHGLEFAEAIDYIKKIVLFRMSKGFFTIVNPSGKKFNEINCFILGSDTIWNLDSEYYKHNKPIFWGDFFIGKKIISYAGSIANTNTELLLNNQEFSKSINQWAAISVRDRFTQDAFSRLTKKNVSLNCDPSLLLQECHYKKFCQPQPGNYIFIYLFKPLSNKQNENIRKFADDNNLKVICGAQRKTFELSDKHIINSPNNFIRYMLGAKYVITDTYHGTLFSTNFNKQFVTINRNLKKANDYLSFLDLTNRIINTETNISEVIITPINYTQINQTINKIRHDSLSFLKNNLSTN